MKMIKRILLVPVIIFYSILTAQDVPKINDEIPILYLPHGYIIESISGTGFQKIVRNNVSNINSNNPASASNFTELSFGLSCQFESLRQPAWTYDFKRKSKYPQSLGLIIPIKMFRLGLGFNQRYSSILDFGEMELVTTEQPDGTGEYFNITKTEVVYSYSGIFSYSIKEVLGENNNLSLGLMSNINWLDLNEQIYTTEMDKQFTDYSYTLGIQYTVGHKYYFGLCYLNGPLFKDRFMFEGEEIYINQKMPDKMSLSFFYNMNSHIDISVNLDKVYWRQQSDDLLNYYDISSSIIGKMTKQISLSLAVLSTGYHSKSYQKQINNNLYGLYLLGGLNIRLLYFDVDLAYVTSTRYSGDWRKQKIGKITIGFYL
jgi:hypothetical protein